MLTLEREGNSEVCLLNEPKRVAEQKQFQRVIMMLSLVTVIPE